jgi:WD40 repeat protein
MLRLFMSYFVFALLAVGALALPDRAVAQDGGMSLGLEVQTLSPERAQTFDLLVTEGVIVLQATPDGAGARAGIQRGDAITHVGTQSVKTREEFLAAVASMRPGQPVQFVRHRGTQAARVQVALGAAPPRNPSAPAPVLILDTGGHMSLIRGLAATQDGRYLVSAGDDKVVRVWDWQLGKTVRTFHGLVGIGEVGKIFALGLSPAGVDAPPGVHRWIAVAGRMNDKANDELVRLYDFQTGRLERIFVGGHNNNINALAFSPDGRRLITGAWDNNAVIWNVQTGAIEQVLKGHKETLFAVAFTRDGQRVITGSYDHTLKLWDAQTGRLIETMNGHDEGVSAIAVNPATGIIFSGDYRGVIRRWDGQSGRALGQFADQGTMVGTLAFSRDGKTLISGIAKLRINPIPYGVRVFDVATGKLLRTYDNFNNNVQASAILPEGNLVANAGGSSFTIQVWDYTNGRPQTGADGRPLELAGTGRPRWAAAFSSDSSIIAWGNTWTAHTTLAQNPLEFQLRLPSGNQRMGQPERIPSGADMSRWVRAPMSMNGNSLVHRKGGNFGYDAILDVVRDGKTITSIERPTWDGFQHLTYGFTPNGRTIVSGGGSGAIIAYGLDGTRLGQFVGHESDIWSVTPSPNGRYLVSGSGDQTVRLWNLETRKLIVTLFHGTDGEWVMWTPDGYFTGSANAGELVGWQQNQGLDHEARYVKAYQLRHFLRRPDIVERAIVLADAEAAVNELAGNGPTLADLVSRPPPEVYVGGDKSTADGKAKIVLEVERTGRAVLAYDVHIGNYDKSGSFVPERKLSPRTFSVDPSYKPVNANRDLVGLELDLRPGTNLIGVVARTDAGETPIAVTQILSRGDALGEQIGTLRILAIGIDRYPNASPFPSNLTLAGKDARDFAETAKKEMGPRHSTVLEPEVLYNGAGGAREPTLANIEAALKRLSQSGPKDTVVLFIAGHGESRGGQYVLLPSDFVRRGESDPGQNIVEWKTIRDALANASGQRLVFLDTCHAGNAYNDGLVGDAKSFAFAAFTATAAGSVAKEDPRLGQGRFTAAVLSGLEGKAMREGVIEVYDLGPYVARQVKTLSNGEQEAAFYPGAGNFLIVKR